MMTRINIVRSYRRFTISSSSLTQAQYMVHAVAGYARIQLRRLENKRVIELSHEMYEKR